MKKRFFKIYLCLSILFLAIFIFLPSSHSFGQNANRIAKEIVPDAGVISSSWEGKSNKIILIFEETHISPVGQIEIALMLTRLHNCYNVNTIALEGAFVRDGTLDRKWFYNLSDGYVREEVALQLLRKGEISGAEFIALTTPEVKVYGVEKEEEYTFEISHLDNTAPTVYLFAIAEKLFPEDKYKIGKVNRLADEFEKASDKDKIAKLKELMDYMINANQWTKGRYKDLTMKDKIVSTEELLINLEEIRSKAEEVNANVGEYKEHFNRLVEFYKRASNRTETIIANTLKLYDDEQKVPIALIIGAAHTAKASDMLRKQGVSWAVVRPISLARGDTMGDLTIDAFERKRKKLSVDDKGLIGSFLDGRWKPPTIFDQIWFRSESELKYITILLAHAVAEGDHPPFESIKNDLSNLKHVKIAPNSFNVIGNELIFKVEAETNKPNYWETFWVRTVMMAYKKRKSLEERLKEILEDVREKGIPMEGVAVFSQQEYKDFSKKFPKAKQVLKSLIESKDDNVYINLYKISDSQRKDLGKEVFEEIVKHVEEGGLKIEKISRGTIAAYSKNLNVITAVKLWG